MKYFWDFVEYITMRELKQDDAIVRNYAIEKNYAGRPLEVSLKGDNVRLALHRMGFNVRGNNVHALFGEVLSALHAKQYYINEYILMAYLAQWYNYHRIKTGEIVRWRLRKPLNDLTEATKSVTLSLGGTNNGPSIFD